MPFEDLSARFLDIVIPLFDHPIAGRNTLIGLIPVPYQTPPGIANISVDWTDTAGHHNHSIPVEIRGGQFQAEKLQVTASRVNPPKESDDKDSTRTGGNQSRLFS